MWVGPPPEKKILEYLTFSVVWCLLKNVSIHTKCDRFDRCYLLLSTHVKIKKTRLVP